MDFHTLQTSACQNLKNFHAHYPCLQHQQAFPGNIPVKQVREIGKLTEDIHHSLLSKSNSPVSSLALQQNTCYSLPPIMSTHTHTSVDPTDLLLLTSPT